MSWPPLYKELYYGNIQLDSRRYGPDSPYVQAAKRKQAIWEKLMDSLNEQEKELFEKYDDNRDEMESISRYNTYSEALRLGIRLMAETFAGGAGDFYED